MKYKGSLQRTMIIYFLMIGFASSLIAGEFIFDVNSKALRSELIQNVQQLSNGKILAEAAFRPIQILEEKAILMLVLTLVVVLILLSMFIKNITEPLQEVIDVSKLIAAGDLSQTVNIRVNNELAEVGGTVNDLTSNLQEMLLLSKEVCTAVEQFTAEVSHILVTQKKDLEDPGKLEHRMHLLNTRTKFMNEIVLHCKFYGMRE